MNINDIIKTYHTDLDSIDKNMIDKNVAEKGIEEYLNQQLIYLDCTRILKGMRMMQTIGYPYKRELMTFFYVLNKAVWVDGRQDEHRKEWSDKLIERHKANLEYEKENPPIWYDGKPKKVTARKRKAKEADMFPEETKKAKISKTEAKLKAKILNSSVGFGSFKLKKD